MRSLRPISRTIFVAATILLLLACGLFAFRLLGMLRGSGNLGYVALRQTDEAAALPESLQVFAVSPWKSRTVMSPGDDGTWEIPMEEKRTVAGFLVITGDGHDLEPQGWQISISPNRGKRWTDAESGPSAEGLWLTLPADRRPTTWIPTYHETINWLGDLRALRVAALSVLSQLLALLVAIPVVRFLWDAAAPYSQGKDEASLAEAGSASTQ